jgi:hypothetical protein
MTPLRLRLSQDSSIIQGWNYDPGKAHGLHLYCPLLGNAMDGPTVR